MREKLSLKKLTAYAILFFILYIFLPIFITIYIDHGLAKSLLLFYFVNAGIVYFLLRMNSDRKHNLKLQIQDLEEKINILNSQNSHEARNKDSLKEKIRRYSSLKTIIEDINKNLEIESIANNLLTIAFSLIANNRGTCTLYLIDHENQRLALFKAKKEDKDLVIKAKEGDTFDAWVMRHISPLLIEDVKKDFRFDLESLKIHEQRPVSSLISAPLVTNHRFLGLLRLDNSAQGFYSQDDLRLLVTICEFGVVALENGELFQKTEDLAIHDGLTGLFTKGYFLERLKEECKRSSRQDTALSLLMLDIDHFKNYNDKFGHTAGDIVLRTLSSTITESLEKLNPIVSRFGGEEFCIILPHTDKKKAQTIANGLLSKIEKTKITLRRQESNITVSIGVAAFPLDAAGEDELIFKADKAMYEAKRKGRNRVIEA